MVLAALCFFNALMTYTGASVDVCTPILANIRRIQEYNDKRVLESSLWTANLSMAKCLENCYLDNDCLSVNLSPKTQTCIGFKRPFEGLVAQTEAVQEYQLFETKLSFLCTTNEYCMANFDTHCYENRCRCNIGYGFDGLKCRNLAECTSLSNVYSVYPNHCKWGHTLKSGEGHTVSSCGSFCINDPACKSADFSYSLGICWTSYLSWLEVPEVDRDYNNDAYTTIQRECNW